MKLSRSSLLFMIDDEGGLRVRGLRRGTWEADMGSQNELEESLRISKVV